MTTLTYVLRGERVVRLAQCQDCPVKIVVDPRRVSGRLPTRCQGCKGTR
jgi:hypothetical protein